MEIEEEKRDFLVSIIVPVYNVDKYLERCIQSLINQTYTNIQILLVDDGSTDNSGEICDKYAKIDRRICTIHKKNEGVSEARNVGIKNSDGAFITFVDSDDYVSKNYIHYLMSVIIRRRVDAVIASWVYVKSSEHIKMTESNKVDVWKGKETVYHMLLQKHISGSVCGVLYKKRLWENVEFPKGRRHSEDFYVNTIVYANSNYVAFIHDVLYFYFVRENSTQNAEYSIDKMEELELVEKGNGNILNRYPDLEEATRCKLVSSAFHILFFMDRIQMKSDEAKRLIRIIKKNRIRMILGKMVSKKVRIGCLCTFLGIRITQKVYRVLGVRGRINV